MASKKNLDNLVTENLTLNRAVLNSLEQTGPLGKKTLQDVGLAVLKDYREKVERLREEDGLTKAEAREEVLENQKLMVNRIQNATVREVSKKVREKYHGEYYTWLKSTAASPDKKHRRKWGKKFQIGKGEAPGEREGCKCGMEIHVKAKQLRLD